MPQIGVLHAEDIATALEHTTRQYLAGDLAFPQLLSHLPGGEVEVGLSWYKAAASDGPHVHPVVREYQYVLSGHVQLLDIDTGQVHELRSGDFYVIDPCVAHVQKSAADTRILFFKHPSGNDKTAVPVTDDLAAWLADLKMQ